MLIFFQELCLQLFLWLLQLIDGLMEIFSAIAGVTNVRVNGQSVNIIEFLAGNSTVMTIFWCIFILAVGLTCIFTIVGLVKNMIANNRNISSIVGKFFLALLGTMAMLAVVFLGILIANALLQLLARIFQIDNSRKLSNILFDACVGNWINGYNINKINVTSLSVGDIFGTYKSALFGVWPTSWKCNGMVNPNTFMYLPALIASIALAIAVIIATLNLAKRVYEIFYLFLCMPVSMSTLPLDDGARFKNWREQFVTKIILAYGAVLAVNVFLLLLPLITSMSLPNVSSFGNTMFKVFMIVGGAMLIPAGQTLFARLFGTADDMHAGGGWMRSVFYGGRAVGGMAVRTIAGIFRLARRNDNATNGGGNSGGSSDGGSDGDSSSDSGGDDERYIDDGGADMSATEGGGSE
ncbi:MAG: hypothetical protein NC489_43300 [Ruminococcus flavefaciens]|nr:hypothetical protein [Ruminococcus flavefaciens]